MMDEEPSRYRSLTGATAYVEKPFNSQIFREIKQCEDPESMRVRKRELNPAAIRCTEEESMVKHDSDPEGS
jgi:hypothetical protein